MRKSRVHRSSGRPVHREYYKVNYRAFGLGGVARLRECFAPVGVSQHKVQGAQCNGVDAKPGHDVERVTVLDFDP